MKEYVYRAYKTVNLLEHTTIMVKAEDADKARVLAMECLGGGEDDNGERDWNDREEGFVNETLSHLVSIHDSPHKMRALL